MFLTKKHMVAVSFHDSPVEVTTFITQEPRFSGNYSKLPVWAANLLIMDHVCPSLLSYMAKS